jgi:hypothetical protein
VGKLHTKSSRQWSTEQLLKLHKKDYFKKEKYITAAIFKSLKNIFSVPQVSEAGTYRQCFGSGSRFGSGLKWISGSGFGIRMRIRAGKNCFQKRGKRRHFMFEEFSVGLEASPGA